MTSRNWKFFQAAIGFSLVILGGLYWAMLDTKPYTKTQGLRMPFTFRDMMEEKHATVLHIAAVTYGIRYVYHTVNIIKMILLLTESDIQWYVFTTDDSHIHINELIEKWPGEYSRRVKVLEAPMICDEWLAYRNVSLNRLHGMGIKPCVFCSFDKTIIKDYTEKFIYLDLDILPVDDFSRAWGIFRTFGEEQIMGMSRADIRYIRKNFTVYDARYGLNSGVIFVNLKHMANLNFENKYVQCAKEKYHYDYILGVGPNDDQDVLNVYFYKYPYQAVPVGCNWNYRKSMEKCIPGDLYNCDEAKHQGVSIIHATVPNLLEGGHFNALYNCSLEIDLTNIKDTIACFQDGISYFYTNRNRTCKHHEHYLRPFETILARKYPTYFNV